MHVNFGDSATGESGICTDDSNTSHARSSRNGETKHTIDNRQSPSNMAIPASHVERNSNSDTKAESLQLCNGGITADESLVNENNNADNDGEDNGDVTPRLTPNPNGDIMMDSETGADGLNYSTMSHQQEMATVTDGNTNSSEHNNQPFDLHSQASSGEFNPPDIRGSGSQRRGLENGSNAMRVTGHAHSTISPQYQLLIFCTGLGAMPVLNHHEWLSVYRY